MACSRPVAPAYTGSPRHFAGAGRRRLCAAVAAALALGAPLAGFAVERSTDAEKLSELWIEPADLESRDLFLGPGGGAVMPRSDVDYTFRALDTAGHSDGYEVEDPAGRRWKVKVGDEAQAEIAVSRILWAIGYHQPVLHYLRRWRLVDGPHSPPPPGRFRLESDHEKQGEWKWRDNPFDGTRPLHGLLVANLVLANWDLTTSNNRIYRQRDARGREWTRYVVQDVGGSLGRSRFPTGSRNDIDDFEREDLIARVEAGRPVFDHHSYHAPLLKRVGRDDVVWACRLFARLSDRQLGDAFRAAHYPPEIATRYVRRIRQKVAQGLALAPAARPAP